MSIENFVIRENISRNSRKQVFSWCPKMKCEIGELILYNVKNFFFINVKCTFSIQIAYVYAKF